MPPGSLLGAFWVPFACPLGALGTSLGDFGSTLAALVGRFAEVVFKDSGNISKSMAGAVFQQV